MDRPARIGRYEVELQLGEGGLGRVFLARDPVLRRQVALKVLRDDVGLTPVQCAALAERLRDEARAAATLWHPAIVPIHDMGDDERVGVYVVYELVRGPTLRERLQTGPLPIAEVAQIARSLGSALTHAHGAGLIHGRVKPENVMSAPTGPKITDFGMPASPGQAPSSSPYTAPEIAGVVAPGPKSDQFALAATLYEAATGHRAFPGGDPAGSGAVQRKLIPPQVRLSALRGFLGLEGVFARALSRDPAKRFLTCEAFGSALAAELEGPRVTFLATSGPLRSSVARATRRWQNGVALAAVAIIVTLLLIGRSQQAVPADGATPKNAADDRLLAASRGRSLERLLSNPTPLVGAPMQRVVAPLPGRLLKPSPSTLPLPSATSPEASVSFEPDP